MSSMKTLLLILMVIATACAQSLPTFDLPDGAQLIIGGYNPGFSCEGRIYGYYADQGNACAVFHICVPVANTDGTLIQTLHYPFICGNQTVFNQEFLICDHAENVDCSRATDYYAKNQDFGKIPPQN